MKSIKAITALVLLTGFTSLSYAGPGIDYWNRMTLAAKNRTAAEAKAKTDAPAKAKTATEVATTCAKCECCAKKV